VNGACAIGACAIGACNEFTAADGVRVAAVSGTFDYLYALPRAPLAGSFSAWLASTSDSRLSQPVDLTGASGTITLAWTDAAHANLAAVIPGQGSYYRVVVRDAGGAQLATALTAGSPAGGPPAPTPSTCRPSPGSG